VKREYFCFVASFFLSFFFNGEEHIIFTRKKSEKGRLLQWKILFRQNKDVKEMCFYFKEY
jgi:hypothetical protein